MKTKILILFIFLLANIGYTFAQDDVYGTTRKINSNKINSGFVFVDGKYIEPPYVVKLNKKTITINNIIVHGFIKPKKEKKKVIIVKDFPGYIPDTIKGLNKILNYVNPKTGNTLLSDVVTYYVNKYGEKDAFIYIKNYVCNIQGIECVNDNSQAIKIKVQNYDKSIPIVWQTLYLKNENTDRDIKKEYSSYKKDMFESFIDNLKNGNAIFIYNKKRIYVIYKKEAIVNFVKKGIDIINDDKLSKNEKIEKLKKFNIQRVPDELINSKIIIGNSLKRRINNDKTSKDTFNNYNAVNQESGIVQTKYSPSYNDVIYICPYTYASGFAYDGSSSIYYQSEIDLLNNKLTGYGYNQAVEYIDNSDNQIGDIPISVWRNLNAGVIFISAHGTANNTGYSDGIIIAIFDETSNAINYVGSEQNIEIQLLVPDGYSTLQNCIVATDQFWETNTKLRFNNNNTLVFVSACKGGCIADNIGGIVFSFDQEINITQSYNDIKKILKNMIGETNSGNTRTAIQAFQSVNSTNDLNLYPFNSDFTLCPATKDYYPADGDEVGAEGDGYFEVDTWCDTSVPLYPNDQNSPISFNSQYVTITNLQWADVQNGRSKKITFHWSASQNDYVDVHINHLKFQSAPSENGEYHVLDYNKQAPNTEDGNYSFTINTSIPTEAPVADFTYSVNNNQVVFTDQSQNNPTDWDWNFGDGETSTQQNPSHTYASTGSYTVSLTASNIFGNNTKAQTVYISNTPATVSISGKVTDDNNVAISGATVTAKDNNNNVTATTTTDGSGNYSLSVPYGWTGTLTASATGYNSFTYYFTNSLIDDMTGEDFTLAVTNVYFTYDQNQSDLTIYFHPTVNTPTGCDYYWDFGEPNVGSANYSTGFTSVSHIYSDAGTYQVCLTVECGSSSPVTYCKDIVVENNIPTLSETDCLINFYYDCTVVDRGTSVFFHDESQIGTFYNPPADKDYVKQWKFEVNTPYEQSFHQDYVLGVPYDISYTFNHIGRFDIDFEFGYWTNPLIGSGHFELLGVNGHNFDSWGGIIVIDCGITSIPIYYNYLGHYGFDYNAVYSDYGATPYRYYAGSFSFDGRMNQLLNSYVWTLEACNEIVITGNQEFIADGTHELILENIQNDCINNQFGSKMFYTNDIPLKESIETITDTTNLFACYPNPCTKYIIVSMNIQKGANFKIDLFSVNGTLINKMLNKYLNEGRYYFSYDVDNLNPGVYVIKITNQNIGKNIKIVKLTN